MKDIKAIRLLVGTAVIGLFLASAVSSARAAATLGSISLTEVKCRIFTPNGDGYNDKARFELDNPEQLPVGGAIFDTSGARVASIQQGTTPDVLLWDGKDEDGQVVAGGVYIYQLEFQGKHATGTLAVAR
jgi:ABC-type glycerol-3-phosphate transport system substrate-binding protein